MRPAALVTCAVLALSCLPLSAQTMKPGLWEIHNKMKGGGTDDAMAELQKSMAQMSPQQRKQMEAAMAAQGVKMAPGAGAMAMQMCFTREMVERNDVPMQDGCKVTQNQRGGKTQKFAFSCSNPPSSGEGQVTYESPEAYTSRMTVKTTVGGKAETTTMDASGKWLKADCGNVKPVQVPKK
jgi:hypothetical protein